MGQPTRQLKTKNNPFAKPHKPVFRLYITAGADSSRRALANVKYICREYLNDYQLEIVDTLRDPLRARQDGIIVTPTLVKLSPEPSWTMVGDLSEDAKILASMHAAPLNSHPNSP
jgi:circadian clock protein KaiB